MQDKNGEHKVGPLPEVDENGFPLTRNQVQESYQGPSKSRTEQSYNSTSGTRLKEGESLERYSFPDPDKDNQKGGILYNIGKQYQERKQNLQKQTENDIDRQRRMARYSAWGDFLKAIGNMAGGAIGGAAPVPMQYDPSRTLEAFRNVDRLRSELKNTDNDPMLSWLRNAELSRKAELERQKLDAENKLTDLKNRSKFENYSGSKGESVTQRSGVSGSSVAGTYENPAVLGGGDKNSGEKPFHRLFKSVDDQGHYTAVDIDRSKALMIARDVINAAADANRSDRKKQGYKSPFGLNEEKAKRIAERFGDRLGNLSTVINANDDAVSDNAIREVLSEINHDDYLEGIYYDWALKEVDRGYTQQQHTGQPTGGLGWGNGKDSDKEETDW